MRPGAKAAVELRSGSSTAAQLPQLLKCTRGVFNYDIQVMLCSFRKVEVPAVRAEGTGSWRTRHVGRLSVFPTQSRVASM